MLSRASARPAAVVVPGLLAGLAGGVLIDAYLLLTSVAVMHATTVHDFYAFVASGAIGTAAYRDPNALVIGIALHAIVSLAWGVGYAFVAASTPQVRTRPFTSGIVFGIVVMIAMQLVEVAANVYTLPNTFALCNGFVAHTLFFGIPVAWIVAARLRA